jgi:hypothetical protein
LKSVAGARRASPGRRRPASAAIVIAAASTAAATAIQIAVMWARVLAQDVRLSAVWMARAMASPVADIQGV